MLNRDAVYEEIAKHDIIPIEHVLRACHVFTTTSQKLYDPTARRLENFWRRVLGGDRRYLPGRVLARLFRDISEEVSFVKLRGPSNRYEPPSPTPSGSRSVVVQATSLTPESKPSTKSTTPSTKVLHPILKKPRHPSASGPRPTARFASPPEFGNDEDDTRRDESTALVSAGNVGGSTTKEDRKKGRPQIIIKRPGIVASTSRQRPKMPRRTSSQSSAGASDIGSKNKDSTGPKSKVSQDSVPTIREAPESQPATTSKGQENTALSAKAAGKRPVFQPQLEQTTLKPGTEVSQQKSEVVPVEKVNVKAKPQGAPSIVQHQSKVVPPKHVSIEAEPQSTTQSRRGKNDKGSAGNAVASLLATVQRQKTQPPPPCRESSLLMTRSSSDTGPSRPTSREPTSRSFVPSSSLMSSTKPKLDTSVIGQGTISGFTDGAPLPGAAGAAGVAVGQFGQSGVNAVHDAIARHSIRAPADSSGFGEQMKPTQPRTSVSIPLGRTKSQLAVLLDRKGNKNPKP